MNIENPHSDPIAPPDRILSLKKIQTAFKLDFVVGRKKIIIVIFCHWDWQHHFLFWSASPVCRWESALCWLSIVGCSFHTRFWTTVRNYGRFWETHIWHHIHEFVYRFKIYQLQSKSVVEEVADWIGRSFLEPDSVPVENFSVWLIYN